MKRSNKKQGKGLYEQLSEEYKAPVLYTGTLNYPLLFEEVYPQAFQEYLDRMIKKSGIILEEEKEETLDDMLTEIITKLEAMIDPASTPIEEQRPPTLTNP